MGKIAEHWPELYQDIRDFMELAGTEEAELQLMENAVSKLLNDQFVPTASESTIKRREKMLNIQADPIAETLEFRKSRILNRYRTKPPFSIRYLQNRIDALVGPGLVTVTVNPQTYTLTIAASLPNAAAFKEVAYTIQQVKPANIVYEQTTDVAEGIVFSETMTRTGLTRLTRLSTGWRLGRTPFAERQEEILVL